MNQPLDPTKVKTQLNVPITYDLMERLTTLSIERRQSKAALVRDAIEQTYFLNHLREQTRDAGATR